MGNRYNHQNIHHFNYKTIFLPMFCRFSIKDIKLNNPYKDCISTEEPSSPKVSCMGQVKRNNRVIGFPTTNSTVTRHHKYTKLKKIFSSKTVLPPATTIPPTTTGGGGGCSSGSKSCRTSRDVCLNNSKRLRLKNRENGNHKVNIGEMDPPLPVVKKVAQSGVGRDEVNIWKRRFNGTGLKGLQIEQIHLSNYKFQSPQIV